MLPATDYIVLIKNGCIDLARRGFLLCQLFTAISSSSVAMQVVCLVDFGEVGHGVTLGLEALLG